MGDEMSAVQYKKVFEKIEEHFRGIDGWAEMKNYENTAKYVFKAESLIELLEVDTCGSIGGFGPGQQESKKYDNPWKFVNDNLYNRSKWMEERYK